MTPLDPSEGRRLRQLLDDCAHVEAVAGREARDWNRWACERAGVDRLGDLDAVRLIRLVAELQAERTRLREGSPE